MVYHAPCPVECRYVIISSSYEECLAKDFNYIKLETLCEKLDVKPLFTYRSVSLTNEGFPDLINLFIFKDQETPKIFEDLSRQIASFIFKFYVTIRKIPLMEYAVFEVKTFDHATLLACSIDSINYCKFIKLSGIHLVKLDEINNMLIFDFSAEAKC